MGPLGHGSTSRSATVSSSTPARDPSGIDRYGFLSDPESRRVRGRRIAAVLTDFGGMHLGTARILDVGCSAGLITVEIAAQAGFVVGVDADASAIRYATTANTGEHRPSFLVASGEQLPFLDDVFDAVVCNHVYEHVADPDTLMREIRRVLRPEGVCYFAAGHTLQLIEPHHRVPFLSWLPRPAADALMRATGRGQRYEERFLPPWRLRSLFEGFTHAELVSPAMLRDPLRYGFTSIARLPSPLRKVIRALSRPLALAATTWIWLLRR